MRLAYGGDNGVEILIHIGMDTVELNGRFYELHVAENQYVHAGDSLITVDLENVSAAGYDLTTPIIVTNTADHEPFAKTVQEKVQQKKLFILCQLENNWREEQRKDYRDG